MKIKITKSFYQDGKMYLMGNSYIVKSITANPKYYEIEEVNEPIPTRRRRRANPRNSAITNQDK